MIALLVVSPFPALASFLHGAGCDPAQKGLSEERIAHDDRRDDEHHHRHAEGLGRQIGDHAAGDVLVGGHELHIFLEVV